MPVLDELMSMENWWYDSDVEKAECTRLNLGVHGDRLAVSCLSYGRFFLNLIPSVILEVAV